MAFDPVPAASAPPHEPEWVRHVMWWQIYPLGFVGAQIRPDRPIEVVEHRLGHVEAWLDHLISLGLNGLMLGPVFASTTHGYDIVDYYRVDPRLGDDAGLDRLIAAARDRGIRVLFDGVFNHVSRQHPSFAALAAEGPSSEHAGLFRVRADGWGPGDAVPADVFEGHDGLVVLNHDSDQVADLVVDVMCHWLDRGIDGWRLDAAYAMPPSFWARVLPRVRERHPQAWFSGEVIHGDQAAIVRESTMDSITQYELWQGVWHGIADRNFHELSHALGRHDAMLDTFVPSTFVGNHDVTRLATAIGADLVPQAFAVLLTVAGTPSIYAGDEYAYDGRKEERVGGDDEVRPRFTDAPPAEADLDPGTRAALAAVMSLVAVRRKRPWLHDARTLVTSVTNTGILIRTSPGAAGLLTALSVDDAPIEFDVPAGATVVAGVGEVHGSRLRLPARGWAVLDEE